MDNIVNYINCRAGSRISYYDRIQNKTFWDEFFPWIVNIVFYKFVDYKSSSCEIIAYRIPPIVSYGPRNRRSGGLQKLRLGSVYFVGRLQVGTLKWLNGLECSYLLIKNVIFVVHAQLPEFLCPFFIFLNILFIFNNNI